MGKKPAEIELSLICVNYRSAGNIDALINTLGAGMLDAGWEMIIADNDASSGELEKFSAISRSARVIDSGGNVGFAAGVNIAAREASGDFILLINPDVKVEFERLKTLIETARELIDRLGCIGGRATDATGNPVGCWGDFPTPRQAARAFCVLPFLRGDAADRQTRTVDSTFSAGAPFEVDFPTGALFLTPAMLFRALGGLDERYFLYFEEVDYAMRCRQQGRLNYLAPAVDYVHESGQSFGMEPSGAQFKYWLESLHAYLSRHYGPLNAENTVRSIRKSASIRLALLAIKADNVKRERWSGVVSACDGLLEKEVVEAVPEA